MTEGIIEDKSLGYFFLRGQLLAVHQLSGLVTQVSSRHYGCYRCGEVWGQIICPEARWHRFIERLCDAHSAEFTPSRDSLAGVFEENYFDWRCHSGELLRHNFLRLMAINYGEPE